MSASDSPRDPFSMNRKLLVCNRETWEFLRLAMCAGQAGQR